MLQLTRTRNLIVAVVVVINAKSVVMDSLLATKRRGIGFAILTIGKMRIGIVGAMMVFTKVLSNGMVQLVLLLLVVMMLVLLVIFHIFTLFIFVFASRIQLQILERSHPTNAQYSKTFCAVSFL